MTLVDEVDVVLRKHGEDVLADRLHALLANLRVNVGRLSELQQKQAQLAQEFVSVIQTKCPHHEWRLGEGITITCPECGAAVEDSEAHKFGVRVKQGDYAMYSRAHGHRFGLNPYLRKRVTEKLKKDATTC